MCGIAGIIHHDENPISRNQIEKLTDSLVHRGPDGKGIWLSEKNNIAFGHRRLSIIDLSKSADQPMNYFNGRYWITYNGEIYNYLEIKKELIKDGYSFHTGSDTEVILASYDKWGADMLNRFNGMWAFALYDNENKKILISRDRYGIKPLYYFNQNQKIAFASEVKALLKVYSSELTLDDTILRDIAAGSFYYHATERTFLKNVLALPAGHNLIYENGNFELRKWYKLSGISIPNDFNEQAAMLRELLIDSCNKRLRSDVQVATCLSGGIDSGSIAALLDHKAEKNTNYSHRCFTASFPNSVIDESKMALKLGKILKLQQDLVIINQPSGSELEQMMQKCDGPMHSLAFLPIMLLYKHISETGIKVTLDGQGPDEMLGGYRPLSEALDTAIENKSLTRFLDFYGIYSAQGESRQFSSRNYSRKLLFEKIRKLFFPKTIKDKGNKTNIVDDSFSPVWQPDGRYNSLDKSLYQQFFQTPLPGILNQFDRCSMAYGVECRMPFLDYRIVEFIFSLPTESKVGKGFTKRILREAVKGILPDEIRLSKTKLGFNAPLIEWFTGSLNEWMLDIMSSQSFLESRYFNGKKIRENFIAFINSSSPQWDTAWQFWPPVHLNWWIYHN